MFPVSVHPKYSKFSGLLLLLLLPFSQITAQTSQVFVGNISQVQSTYQDFVRDKAQSFTTGSNALGYTLNSVEISFGMTTTELNTLAVTIRNDNGSNRPGTLLGTLTNPIFINNASPSLETFTSSSGIDLAANTTYWLVVDSPYRHDGGTVGLTSSPIKDSGGLFDWNISSEHLYRFADTTSDQWNIASSVSLFRFRLNGTFVIPPSSDGVAFSKSSLDLTELDSMISTDAYRVVLNTDPGDGVTVTVTPHSDDASSATFSPGTLTFTGGTTGNWNTAQVMAVQAQADADATDETVTISHTTTASGSTAPYHNITTGDVTVNVTDAGHGVRITPVSLNVDEGATATYSLHLLSQPSGAVTIRPSSGDPTLATVTPDNITIAPAAWDRPIELTVTGESDGTVDIIHSISTTADAANYPTSLAIDPLNVTVAPDTIAPRLTITGVPSSRKDNMDFEVTFTFSELVTGFDVSDLTLMNATAIGFSGSGAIYTATITPNAAGEVTVDVAADAAEDAAGNGNAVAMQALSIYQPPALVLTPSELTVGEGSRKTYTVALATKPTVPVVTVTVTGASGELSVDTNPSLDGDQSTLSFSVLNWHIGQPVTVSAGRDEDFDNDIAMLTHRAAGGDYTDVMETLTVTVADDLSELVQSAFLPRFGRTVGQQTVDALKHRLRSARNPGWTSQLAGRTLPKTTGWAESLSKSETGFVGESEGIDPFSTAVESDLTGEAHSTSGRITTDSLLSGTSFALTQASDEGTSFGVWGRGSHSGFESKSSGLKLDSEVTSYLLGVDWKKERHLFGLMLTHSIGKGDYSRSDNKGEIEAELTALVPYLSYTNESVNAWAALGMGLGELSFFPLEVASKSTDIEWLMVSGGTSGALGASYLFGGGELGWNTDVLLTQTRSKKTSELASSSGTTTRFRLGLESRWTHRLASGEQVISYVELAQRYDGGDAETGYGMEVGGGIDWLDPSLGLELSVEGRTLVLHKDKNLKDWSLGLRLSYAADPSTPRGFRTLFSHNFGGSASEGVAGLLESDLFPETTETSGLESSWEAEMAYGFSSLDGLIGSPYTRLSGGSSDLGRLRLGYRLEPESLFEETTTLEVWAEPELASHTSNAAAGLEYRRRF